MLALVLGWGIFSLFLGEEIPVSDGMGYDGAIYANTTLHFDGLFKERMPDKRIQRFVPSGIMYFSLKALRMPLTVKNVVKGFKVMNLFFLLASVWVCDHIFEKLGLKTGVRWTAFTALFLNFSSAVMPYFYPVLTDTCGFFLGILLLYFFLKESLAGLFLTALAGAFTWPTIPYYAFFLACFKKGGGPCPVVSKAASARAAFLWTAVLFFLIDRSFVALRGTFLLGFHIGCSLFDLEFSRTYLSMALYTPVFFLAAKEILRDRRLYAPWTIFKEFKISRFSLMAGLLAAVFFFVRSLNPPKLVSPVHWDYILEAVEISVTRGVRFPLIFIVSHLSYFGPAAYLLIFYWKEFCGVLREYSAGVAVCVLFSLVVLVPNSESRHSLDFFPFYVVFLAVALNRARWGGFEAGLFALISFIFSKVWLPLNTAVDMSRYFMNFGPWMSEEKYQLQGLVALATGAGLLVYLKIRENRTVS